MGPFCSPITNKEGLLPHAPWFNALTDGKPSAEQKGSFLFAQNCGSCHTEHGVNSIRDRLRGRTRDGIYAILGHTAEMVPWMPPFLFSTRL